MKEFMLADAVALGTPDYFSYPAGTIKTLFDDMYLWDQSGETVKGKPAVLFLSHGGGEKRGSRWSLLPGDSLRKLAKRLHLHDP